MSIIENYALQFLGNLLERYAKISIFCALIFILCIFAGCSLSTAFAAAHGVWDLIYIAGITPAKLFLKVFVESVLDLLF